MAQQVRVTRRTTLHLVLTAGLLVGYAVVVLTAGPSGPERFPFFKWSLFSVVPDHVETDYGIRLVEVRGEPLAPPRYLESAGALGLPARSIDAVALIQTLGEAVADGRDGAAAEARAILEERFLAGAVPLRYELVRRRFDLLERRTCDCFTSEEVLGAYDVG